MPAWIVVVPLKPAAAGKSRLGGAGEELVRAIGLDTVSAAATANAVARVIVVTADAATAAVAGGWPRVSVVVESGPAGLNAAIALGIAAAGSDAPRAALLGDLPALRPDELDAALAAASAHDRVVVPDAEGTGSTLVTARTGVPWACAFGDDSLARHLALGCIPLDVDAAAGLRRDVDAASQLTALAERVGPRTRRALREAQTRR